MVFLAYIMYPFLILHSLIGWVFTAVSLMVLSISAWLTRPEGRDAQLRHYHACAQSWARLVTAVCRVRIEIEGLEHMEAAFRRGAVVVACNHQSFMDIPILLGQLPGYFAFVSKAEVFAVPVLGPYMEACGFIKLRRGNQASSREALGDCLDALRSGRSVLMFPEGTRSDAGALGPFKKGPAVLAARAQVAILPVALEGSFNALSKGSFLARPATVTLRAGPLIMPPAPSESAEPVDEATARLRHAVGRLLPARPEPEVTVPTGLEA